MKKLIIISLCMAFLSMGLNAEEIFSISWTDDLQRLSYYDEETFKMGPQSIGVDKEGNVYILEILKKKVVVFSPKGELIESISHEADGAGLAVSPDGQVAIFSPMGKTIEWVKGELKGKKAEAPSDFPSLSEVWYAKATWWGRSGWRIAKLESSRSEHNYPSAFPTEGNNISIVTAFSSQRAGFSFKFDGEVFNSWTSGSSYKDGNFCVVVKRGGQDKDIQIFRCDLSGNSSDIITIPKGWKKVFCPYTVAPDNSVYEMRITKKGVKIIRHNQTNTKTKVLNVSRAIPENLKTFLNNKDEKQVQSEVRGVPSSIDVYFNSEGRVRNVNLQSYLKGVVSAEIYSSWHIEAHKAMAVCARTYSIARKRHSNAMVCTTTHCQAWTSNTNWNAEQGVDATYGQVIYYNGRRIGEALYFAHCNGHTRNSEDYNGWNYVAYLRSKPCCCGYTSYYGHGVGACQWGLHKYATNYGWGYKQIVTHYYSGTEVR